jgi:hypothetical protein
MALSEAKPVDSVICLERLGKGYFFAVSVAGLGHGQHGFRTSTHPTQLASLFSAVLFPGATNPCLPRFFAAFLFLHRTGPKTIETALQRLALERL